MMQDQDWMEGGPGNVGASFEMLLEELDVSIESVNQAGAQVFASGDYSAVERAVKRAGTLKAFRDKVSTLHKEWITLTEKASHGEMNGLTRTATNRLFPNARTPESAYVGPILAALVACGGRGRMSEVLAEVGSKMKELLRPVDFETLASAPDWPRWRNTGQWARAKMVNEGLLRSDSPHGIWEITDAGRNWLTLHQRPKA